MYNCTLKKTKTAFEVCGTSQKRRSRGQGRGGERLGKKRVFVICSSTGKKRIYMSVARNKKRKSILHEENMQDYIYVQYQKTKALVTDLNLFFVGVLGWRWLLGLVARCRQALVGWVEPVGNIILRSPRNQPWGARNAISSDDDVGRMEVGQATTWGVGEGG